MDWPDDAVDMGRIVGAYGVKGWIKVQPHGPDAGVLAGCGSWLVREPVPRELHMREVRRHGAGIVAAAHELNDRDAAEALGGSSVFVSRASFPQPGIDEYYWVDLIGLAVINRDGARLGEVRGLLDTGAHSVLRVGREEGEERLIPFVAAYIDDVDLATRRIRVDWGLDY